MSQATTIKRIDRAIAKVAEIVKRPGGTVFWPIFERLEHERNALADQDRRLEAALNR